MPDRTHRTWCSAHEEITLDRLLELLSSIAAVDLPPIVVVWVYAYWPLIVFVWAYLAIGAIAASWTVWDARRSHRRRGLLWAVGVQYLPALILPYVLSRKEIRPIATPFGDVREVSEAGRLLPRAHERGSQRLPMLFTLRFLSGAIFPGLGQLTFGRWLRTFFLWCMLAFAGFFVVAYLSGEQRTWFVPDEYLPEAREGETVSVNFRVPKYLFLIMSVEFGIFVLWAYGDTVRLGAEKAAEAGKHPDAVRRAFYHLTVARSSGSEERTLATRESFDVGASERCDYVVADEGILPEHVVFYLHRHGEQSGEIRFRCLNEDSTVLHNGTASHAAELGPGDVVEVGGTKFTFDHLA